MEKEKISQKVDAKIFWIKPENGGRKTKVPENIKYTPIIIFDKKYEDDIWSAIVEVIKNYDDYSLIKLTYLSDEADFSNLKKGNTFKLYEGSNYVANGYII